MLPQCIDRALDKEEKHTMLRDEVFDEADAIAQNREFGPECISELFNLA
jgi:hypothetical protein